MERNLVCTNVIAGEDLTGKRYLCVGVNGKLTGATGDVVYGVVKTDCASGEPAEIVVGGEFYVTVGEAVVAGDLLTGGAGGKAMKATLGTNFPFGVALEAGDADSVIRVLIR